MVAGISVFAGMWQLDRMEQRRAFNAAVTERIALPVVDARQLLGVNEELPIQTQWRRVSSVGTYDVANQILIRGRYLDGRYGYEVLTPLVGSDGVALLVNRGWIPAGASATEVPDVPAPPTGTVTITARVRGKDTNLGPQGAIIGLPTRAANVIDPKALADELPYPVLSGYVELISQEPAQSAPTVLPAPQLSQGPHLAYAVQWFFFALLGLIAPPIMFRTRRSA